MVGRTFFYFPKAFLPLNKFKVKIFFLVFTSFFERKRSNVTQTKSEDKFKVFEIVTSKIRIANETGSRILLIFNMSRVG